MVEKYKTMWSNMLNAQQSRSVLGVYHKWQNRSKYWKLTYRPNSFTGKPQQLFFISVGEYLYYFTGQTATKQQNLW